MRRITRVAVAGLLAAAPIATTIGATGARASDDDVIREGWRRGRARVERTRALSRQPRSCR
jgi:hypothetical protein